MATRRPLTDRQREIGSAKRAHASMQATATKEASIREQQHSQQRVATESALRSDRQSGARKQAITNKVVSTATPSSDSGLVMTVIFVIAGLSVFYLLVTSAANVNTFVGSVGSFLHKVSSTAPLFQTKTVAK